MAISSAQPEGRRAPIRYSVGFLVVLLAMVAVAAGAGSAPATINPNGLSFSAVEGVSFNATVATFTDEAAPSSSHSATIDWGDGSPSYEGKVAPTTGKGAFNVTGSHVYAEEGSYTLRVHVTGGSGSGTTTLTATVTDAPLTAKVAVPAVSEGVALNAAIATVKDQDESDDPSEYRVTIDWGDGSTSAGRGTKTGPGTFSVLGSHTYAEEGGRTVSVKVDDAGGSTVTATQAITVADAPLAVGAPLTIGGTEGTALKRGTVVATFQDANPATTADDLSATVNWGDKTTSRGPLVGTGGIWRVVGSHAYREEGTYRTIVVATDRGGSMMTVEGKAVIRDAPAPGIPDAFHGEGAEAVPRPRRHLHRRQPVREGLGLRRDDRLGRPASLQRNALDRARRRAQPLRGLRHAYVHEQGTEGT